MTALWAMLMGLVAYGLRRYVEPQQLTPDGRIYLAAQQDRPPRPYCLRWLLPTLMGERDWRWMTGAALVLTCPALAWFLDLRGCADWQQLVGVGLWCGLNGVWRLPAIYPVLTDAPAMLLALTAADLALAGHGLAALACAVVAGACHEKAPIFAALFAWSFWPLAGLVAPACAALLVRPGPIPAWAEAWLRHPLAAARQHHAGLVFDARRIALPWGACLAALAGPWSWPAALTVVVAYGQLLVANDLTRLYHWAAPLVIPAALAAVPAQWWPLLLAAHLLNPFAECDA